MNVFFNFRSPAPSVVPLVLLLLAYPMGKFCAYTLPITTYRLPRGLGGAELSLNPGPWNIKEHVLVFIMSNVAVGTPYALNAVVAAEFYYDIRHDYWFSLVLVLGTQLTGFGLAGMCRRFLVWPASMVWPQNLVACTLLNTLHAEDDEGTGGITRYRFFVWTLAGSFFWFFVPGAPVRTFGTSVRLTRAQATCSRRCLRSPSCAGSRRTTSRSTSSSASLRASGCPCSPSTGRRSRGSARR